MTKKYGAETHSVKINYMFKLLRLFKINQSMLGSKTTFGTNFGKQIIRYVNTSFLQYLIYPDPNMAILPDIIPSSSQM